MDYVGAIKGELRLLTIRVSATDVDATRTTFCFSFHSFSIEFLLKNTLRRAEHYVNKGFCPTFSRDIFKHNESDIRENFQMHLTD